MNHEMVIGEKELRSRFLNECDVVTLSPYRVGDRVVRCASCQTVVKSEFAADRCPVCGHAPFIPASVESDVPAAFTTKNRSLSLFFWLLLLSAAGSMLPFAFPFATHLIRRATFGLGYHGCLLCAGIISLTAAAVLLSLRKSRRVWRSAGTGYLLAFVPAAAPYLVLAAAWALFFSFLIVIAVTCIAVIVGIIICLFE